MVVFAIFFCARKRVHKVLPPPPVGRSLGRTAAFPATRVTSWLPVRTRTWQAKTTWREFHILKAKTSKKENINSTDIYFVPLFFVMMGVQTGALQHFKNLRSNNKSTVDGDLSISEGLLLRGNRRDFDGNREDTFAFVHGEDFVTDEPFASRNANEVWDQKRQEPCRHFWCPLHVCLFGVL